MSKNTTDELREQIYKIFRELGVPSADSGGMEKPYVVEAADEILDLISNREKLAYRSGYAAGNAKKNYRKKVDAETLEQLKTEITAGVLSTLRKELESERKRINGTPN